MESFKILQKQFEKGAKKFHGLMHVRMEWPETDPVPNPPKDCENNRDNRCCIWRDIPGERYKPGNAMMHWILKPQHKSWNKLEAAERFCVLSKHAAEALNEMDLIDHLDLSKYVMRGYDETNKN